MTGEGWPMVVDLVDSGIIRILDLAFVTRHADGSITAVDISDLNGDGQLDLSVFEGVSSGLVGQEDINGAASAIEPGSSARTAIVSNQLASCSDFRRRAGPGPGDGPDATSPCPNSERTVDGTLSANRQSWTDR